MATYNVHAGHCPQGQGASGAVGLLKESVEDRKVKNRVISALRGAGHTVYDCTDDTNCAVNQNLQRIVAKCNAHSVDLDVSIHLNAGGGTGVEVWCYDEKTSKIATAICANVSAALDIKNRGVKYSKKLYVLRKTKSPALLVECSFVDNQTDYDHWNADKCGDAIASAIAGKTVQGAASNAGALADTPVITPAAKPNGNDWVRRLQTECNAQGFSKQVVDGIPGKNTLAGCPTCRKGARGNITRLIQERLNSLGFNCGKVDGIFGAGTENAVRTLQKVYGRTIDGIVGQDTWRKLLGL